MNKSASSFVVRAVGLAAGLAVAGCATAKPAPAPSAASSAPSRAAVAAPSAPANAVAPSVAADPPSMTVPMPTGAMTRFVGVVVSVDVAAKTVTLKGDAGMTRTVRIADGAPLTKGGSDAAVKLGDIAVGDRLKLKISGGVAASVHVLVKPAS